MYVYLNHCCIPETKTTLLINYTPIKKLNVKYILNIKLYVDWAILSEAPVTVLFTLLCI